ncbi:hypothetical protein B0H14DRAFT_3137652 [Mycena olivaceomarginata]|nr:hypothetical protein B0H14DRAFT_3137652 [Mycena olivaceomarginata]
MYFVYKKIKKHRAEKKAQRAAEANGAAPVEPFPARLELWTRSLVAAELELALIFVNAQFKPSECIVRCGTMKTNELGEIPVGRSRVSHCIPSKRARGIEWKSFEIFHRYPPIEVLAKIFDLCLPKGAVQPIVQTPLSMLQTEQAAPSSGGSPILALPSEITTEIFTHCVPDASDFDCSWRSIAAGSPELWKVLKIDSSDIPVTLIETWLSRAQALPLSLELKARDYDWDEDDEWDTASVIPILKRHSLTWGEVTLVLPLQQLYLFGSDLPLPLLESLTIYTDSFPAGGQSCTTFRNASALRQLTLRHAVHSALLQLPWTQLTSLDCAHPSLQEELLKILKHTPNLVNCAVAINLESNHLPYVAPLAFLRSLSLDTHIPQTLDILDHVSVPALEVLDLAGILFSGRILVSRLRRSLSQHNHRLRILHIRINQEVPRTEEFIRLLEIQPTLEDLHMTEGSLDLLIAVFRRLSDDSPFLPRLCDLACSPVPEITIKFSATLDALGNALATRWNAPPESFAPIRHCNLVWYAEVSEDLDNIIAAFRPRQAQLVALGINVSVGWDDWNN